MANEIPTHTQLEASSTASDRLRAVVLLSLPTIVGTAFFLTGAIVLEIFGPGDAPAIHYGEVSYGERLKNTLGFAVFLALYFGAAFGALLLPFAAWHAFALSRALGARSRRALWAWTFVVLGVVATALFGGWLIHLDLFI